VDYPEGGVITLHDPLPRYFHINKRWCRYRQTVLTADSRTAFNWLASTAKHGH